MVDPKEAANKIAELAMLKYFPQDQFAQTAIVRSVCKRAETQAQVDWVVERALEIYNEWPGPSALLLLFDSPMMPGAMKPLREADRQKVLGASGQKLIGDGREHPDGKVSADPLVQTGFELLKASQIAKERSWDRPIEPEEYADAPEWLRRLEGIE